MDSLLTDRKKYPILCLRTLVGISPFGVDLLDDMLWILSCVNLWIDSNSSEIFFLCKLLLCNQRKQKLDKYTVTKYYLVVSPGKRFNMVKTKTSKNIQKIKNLVSLLFHDQYEQDKYE